MEENAYSNKCNGSPREMKAKEGSENGSENGSNDDSDTEEKKWPLHRGIRRVSRSPPPRTSDESSNSVSSSATKQASPNVNGGSSSNTSNQQTSSATSVTNIKETPSNLANENAASAIHSHNSIGSSATASNNANASINDKDSVKAALNANSTDIHGTSGQNQTKDCGSCGVPCNQTNASPHGALCKSCFHHWSRTGTLRPTSGPTLSKRSRNNTNNGLVHERHKSKLPRGMYINHDDIVKLAEQDAKGSGDNLVTNMDREISTLLTQIQNNKQNASSLKAKNLNKASAALNPGAIAVNRYSSRWSNDEYQLAIKGMRKHGKDFQTIAEIIGTKTESQVNQFYTSNRKKYNLDEVIKEFEAKQQQEQQQMQKFNESQQKISGNSNTTNVVNNSPDVKTDVKKSMSDDDVMEIDLIDDIPNQEDEDMDDVTIIEPDSMPSTTQKSNNIVEQVLPIEPMDSISITAISSSSSANGSSHQSQEPVPEVTISPAPGSNSTITSTTSLMAIVEQAKAAAV